MEREIYRSSDVENFPKKNESDLELGHRPGEEIGREIILEKKVKVIKDFFTSSFEEKFPFVEILNIEKGEEISKEDIEDFRNDEKERYEWFNERDYSEIKESFSQENIILLQEIIYFYTGMMGEITEGREVSKTIQRLIEEKKKLPKKFIELSNIPWKISSLISYYLTCSRVFCDDVNKEKLLKYFGEELREIKEENFLEEKETEQEFLIGGFEKLGSLTNIGIEFAKNALQFIPEEIIGKNIKSIKYEDIKKPLDKMYGIDGDSAATYNPLNREVALYKVDTPNKGFFKSFYRLISHESAHSLDPRLIPQEKLSILEEIEMIIDWDKVKEEEESTSVYVRIIKNTDKGKEKNLKSIEDFAETVSSFLITPTLLKSKSPKRFEFCEKWFVRQFPEENFTKTGIDENGESLYYTRTIKPIKRHLKLMEKIEGIKS